MWIVGHAFWTARRMSLWEHFKHLFSCLDPHKITPAWATDIYAIVQWTVIGLLPMSQGRIIVEVRTGVVLYLIFEILQACVYHNLWRIHLFPRSHNMGKGHNPFRTLLMSFANFMAICVLFGWLYWLTEPDRLGFNSLGDAIYFSFVVGATVGFGDIHPEIGAFSRWICVSQIVVSAIMLTIVVGQSIGTLGSLFEKPSPRASRDFRIRINHIQRGLRRRRP